MTRRPQTRSIRPERSHDRLALHVLAALLACPLSGCMTRTWPPPPSPAGNHSAIAAGGKTRVVDAATIRASAVVEAPSASPVPAQATSPASALSPEPAGSPAAVPAASASSAPGAPPGEKPAASPLGSRPAESTPAPASNIFAAVIPPPSSEYPIDLSSALLLAERANPFIGEARARISEALAIQKKARIELVPWLNAGVDYNALNGNLQRSAGNIINISRQALYFGGGSVTSAQGTITVPAVSIVEQLSNAIYDPLVAHQRLHQARFDAAATSNSVLLEVTHYYLELLGATARLEADRRSAAEAEELMQITSRFARTGEGAPADFHRAQTEWRLRRGDVRRAEEDVVVAAARLSRRLHMDPSIRIRPTANVLEVLALVDMSCDLESLIRTAVQQRPEVKSAGADLAANEFQLKQSIARPFLPTFFLGGSGGAFGGGSNIVPPLVGKFGGRSDFDVGAYWTLENFGIGNYFQQKRRRAEVGASSGRQAHVVARVRAEVADAYGETLARREQVDIARVGLATSMDGFQRDLARSRQAVPDQLGRTPRPIEAINSLKLLIEARRRLIRTITDYDQSQFRLFVAMGSPPPLEQHSDPSAPGVSIASLSAPLPPLRAGDRPAESARGSAGAEQAKPAAAEQVLAEAASGLAASLERLAQESGPAARAAGEYSALAQAHQRSMTALLEYDRLQQELFRALQRPVGKPAPDEQVDLLLRLAQAHGQLMKSKSEYDETLWKLVQTLRTKQKAPADPPRDSRTGDPSLTRGKPAENSSRTR